MIAGIVASSMYARPSEAADVRWDENFKSSLIELSSDGLTAHRTGAGLANGVVFSAVRANVGLNTGRWYFEISTNRQSYTGNAGESAGICSPDLDLVNNSTTQSFIGVKPISCGVCYRRYGGGGSGVQLNTSGTWSWISGGIAQTASGVVGVAVDLDAGKAWLNINGGWSRGQSPANTPAGIFSFPPGTTMYPAITIQDGIVTVGAAMHTLNAGNSPFIAVNDAAFLAGGVLAGFGKGWGRT